MPRTFRQIDVFGARPLTGNALAVVLDGEGLTTAQMQALTRWIDLPETTFLLPPASAEADYRVRIFTLAGELPFAGHPTLGSCHAWLEAGGAARRDDVVVQECGAGLVPIRRGGGQLAFAAPPLVRSGPVDTADLDPVLGLLGLQHDSVVDAAWVDNGPGWMGLLLEDAEAVLAVDPPTGTLDSEGTLDVGLVGPHAPGSETALEVRALFTDHLGQWREDPVTGSLNASLAQWLLASERADAPYVARQGTRLGRDGRVFVDRDDDGQVWIGGATVTCIEGALRLDGEDGRTTR